MIFTIPPLPYAMDALEPFMSMETLEYHYGKHLQTYVDNLNRLAEGTPYSEMSLEDIVLTSDGPLYNNAAQVWNHTFFFESLTPVKTDMPKDLKTAIEQDFGSVAEFEKRLKAAATGIFGSGWAWLVQDRNGKLTIDVWEHAYYIDYRNRRAEYVDKCWNIIDWAKVAQRMKTAHVNRKDMSRYVCITCGWVYDPEEGDPESGIPAGTPFDDIPEEWLCPACGVGKDMFEKEH